MPTNKVDDDKRATSDNGSLCRHAGRWDTRDTRNDIMTVTGMTVTVHNIGNGFADGNIANRNDYAIRPPPSLLPELLFPSVYRLY